jgi:intracellular septation protein A
MFAPMVILEITSYLGVPMLGIYIALAWLILVAIVIYIIRHVVSLFAIITFIMVLTQTIAVFLKPKFAFLALIPSVDNTIVGLIFIGSMLRPRPFIMALIGKETIERTEAKYGKSKYFFKAWFDINIVWGMFYILQGLIISYTMLLNVDTGKLLNFLFGWPAVLILLYFSVAYPTWYWKKNWEKMKVEIEAAKQYESHEATA